MVERDRIKVLIYGDSFAAHLYPGLIELGRSSIEVRQYTATGCHPFTVGKARCDDIYNKFFSGGVLQQSAADVVIVSANWPRLYKKLGAEEFSRRLHQTIVQIKKYGKHVILGGQSPIYDRAVPYIIMIQRAFDRDLYIAARDENALNDELKNVAAQSGAIFMDFYNVACTERSCLAALGGVPLHRDDGHMTLVGSKYFSQPLLETIIKIADPPAVQTVLKDKVGQ